MYRELDAFGNPQGTSAFVTRDMVGPGRRADRRIQPPGWQGDGRRYREARGHLHAAQLDGSYNDRRNFVTLRQDPTNNSHMKVFENDVARRARSGEVVEYSVTPIYDGRGGAKPPGMILMTARGSRRSTAKVIANPSGLRR
ncbi:MAG: DNA/RNA non-specific endonuclease [Phenylobacterium sp.]|nr:DNA/RNA non-specific endonuclease [Phenylobacterium sp.]